MRQTIERFFRETAGNFAMMGAVAMIPLVLAVGLSVDYTRYTSAHKHLQEIADAAALSLAAAEERNDSRLRALALDHVNANNNANRVQEISIRNLAIDNDRVTLGVQGAIQATFMGIAGYDRLPVAAEAVAEKAIRGNAEVALILDNTWSMSATDAGGRSRISMLKTAASQLVRELLSENDGSLRIGLVPYAEYVNVGTHNRNASWLSVPADYTEPGSERRCEMRNTRSECVEREPTYACTREVDGIKESATCGGGCRRSVTRIVPPYEHCTGGGAGREYKWFGCVGSRTVADTRLRVDRPEVRYPGYVERTQNCLSRIMPLTSDRGQLLSAIDSMVVNVGSYRPYTYIPSGLVWGYNLLTPGEPFAGAEAYDSGNQRPRKVAVLMTDGENTLRFSHSDGRHVRYNGAAAARANQLAGTNKDSLAICEAMKAQHIELFTVAFMVTDPDARRLMEQCATNASHYFDARDADALLAAFSDIARSLRVVRLAR
jgi:Flp pilus assembly protein TadG